MFDKFGIWSGIGIALGTILMIVDHPILGCLVGFLGICIGIAVDGIAYTSRQRVRRKRNNSDMTQEEWLAYQTFFKDRF